MENRDIARSLIVDSLCEAGRILNKKIFIYILIYILIYITYSIAFNFAIGEFSRDSTDGEERSGMKIHIDNLTGCHYLSTRSGGMNPRISSDGSHYGCRAIEVK